MATEQVDDPASFAFDHVDDPRVSRSLPFCVPGHPAKCRRLYRTNYPFYNEPGFGAPRDDERNKSEFCPSSTTVLLELT